MHRIVLRFRLTAAAVLLSCTSAAPVANAAIRPVAPPVDIDRVVTAAASEQLDCVRNRGPELLVPRAAADTATEIAPGCEILSRAPLACAPALADPARGTRTAAEASTLDFDRVCHRVRCRGETADVAKTVVHLFGGRDVQRRELALTCDLLAEDGHTPDGSLGGDDSHAQPVTCGDFTQDGGFTASDALGVLRAAVGSATCLLCVCDVNNSGSVTATDALNLLKYAVGQAVALLCPADGNPVSWDGGGDGVQWTNALNWSNDRVPEGCDNVTIATTGTVVHSSGSNAARSVSATSALDLTGGTLATRDSITVAAPFRLMGATLRGADVLVPANDAPLTCTTSAGTLDNVVMDADLDLSTTSSYANIANGLTLNGTATVGSNAGLYFTGTGEQALDGTGTIEFTGTNGQVYNYTATLLRIGPDLTIHGTTGNVGGSQSNTALITEGTIECDTLGTITVGAPAGTWTNTGVVRAKNGGAITTTGTWTNEGTLGVDGSSTLNLGGTFTSAGFGTLDRAGGTVNVTGRFNVTDPFTLNAQTGSWRLFGGTIAGGPLDADEGAEIICTTSAGTLDDATLDADLNLATTSSYVNVANGLTLNGTATVGTSAGLYFTGAGEQVLDGTGIIEFTGTNGQVYNYGGTLLRVGPDITIHGTSGNVGGSQSNTGLVTEGTIASDAFGVIQVGSVVGTWTNTGVVRAQGGGTITTAGTWINDGTFALDSSSTLNLGGTFSSDDVGTFDRTGGTVNLTGRMNVGTLFTLNAQTGSWRLLGGTIAGGTVDAADGAEIVYTTSAGTLDGVSMDADMDLSTTSSYVNVANGLTVNGVASIGTSAGLYFTGAGEQALDGTGEIEFTGTNGQVYNYGGTSLRIGPDVLIHGTNGYVGGSQTNTGLATEGTIEADGLNTIQVGPPSGTWTNTGVVRASNGTITTAGTWNNQGTFGVEPGGILNLGGTFSSDQVGTFDRDGGTVNLTGRLNVNGTFTLDAQTGSWRLLGGTIAGGTVGSADGATIVFTTSAGTLDDVTMDAPMDFTTTSSYVNVANGLTLNGTATVATSAGLYFTGAGEQLLDGTGTIEFTGTNAQIYNYAGTLLRIGSGVLIRGTSGNVGGSQTNTSLATEGTIDSDGGGTIRVGTTNAWTNTGSMLASGGNLQTTGAFTNGGDLEIASGRELQAQSGFAQSGAGSLTIELAGTGNANIGRVLVTGAAALGGTLEVVLAGGYVPNIGDTFQIMTFGSSSGAFATLNGLDIGGGKQLQLNTNATDLTLEVVAG